MQISNSAGTEANVERIQDAVAALNDHDAERLLPLVAPDMIIHYAELVDPLVGRDVWLRGFEIMRDAFPDFHLAIDDLVAAGDRVALRLRITGTHTGEFQGIRATGRQVSYVSHKFYRLSGGMVVEEWICLDTMSLFTQLQNPLDREPLEQKER